MSNVEYTPRLKKSYKDQYSIELMKELNLKNINEVPKLEKIIISSGTGKKRDDKKYFELVKSNITKIAGQAPIDKKAKKSIASFKIRSGMSRMGLIVTLRNDKMYEFLDRFINIALPRVRDFHGVGLKFDKKGNYNLGIVEQSIFPELNFEDTQILHGLQITFVIKNVNPEHSRKLLEKFGMPFAKQGGRA